MSKVFISVRLIDEDGNVTDWRATFDLLFEGVANTKNLVPRVSEIVLRELVRRGLIAPTEGEVPKAPTEPRSRRYALHGSDGKFAKASD